MYVYRLGNQKWTIQRHTKHWSHKTPDKDKQNQTYTIQKTKTMSRTDTTICGCNTGLKYLENNIQSNLLKQSPLLSSHLYLRVTFFLSCH